MKKPLGESRVAAPGHGPAVIVLCAVQFVDVLGVTEVITALPKILVTLPAPQTAASVLLTAYAMCFGGLLMFGARLGDRCGHRKVLQIGILAFAAGSLLAATAPSEVPLIAGRCLQGGAAAVSVPTALRLLTSATPLAADRRHALSAWSAAGAAAGAVGYVLGGALTEFAGWRAMFWINLPIAALMALGVARHTSIEPQRRSTHLDAPGAVLFTTVVMGLVLAATEFQQPGRLRSGLLIITVVTGLAAALVSIERRAPSPLISIEALRQSHLGTGVTAAFLNCATTSPAIAIATLQLQGDDRLTPAAAGLRLLPFSLCVIAGSTAAARPLRRLSQPVVIAIGLGAIGAADTLLTAFAPSLLPFGVAIAGLGIGISSVASTSIGISIPEPLQGMAAGAMNTAAQLGTALGVATLLLLVSVTTHSELPLTGHKLGWAVAAVLAVLGAAWATTRRPRTGPDRHRSANGE